MQLDSKFLVKTNLLPSVQDLANKDPALLVKRLAQVLLGTDSAPFSGGSSSNNSSGTPIVVLTSSSTTATEPIEQQHTYVPPPSIDFSDLAALEIGK